LKNKQSVANTAKRVIVIVGVAIVLGESLDPIKLLGCAIGIGVRKFPDLNLGFSFSDTEGAADGPSRALLHLL
jgi:hypothetical protein